MAKGVKFRSFQVPLLKDCFCPKLISRKIWVIEKLLDFHTVESRQCYQLSFAKKGAIFAWKLPIFFFPWKWLQHTALKIHNFSIIQILREIKFEEQRLKICHSKTFRGSEFSFVWFLCTFWRLKFPKSTKFRAPKNEKIAVLELVDYPKLISRNNWVTEKSYNFHTVLQ